MEGAKRSQADLAAEVKTLRRRVEELEHERQTTATLLHGDPERNAGPLVEQVPAVVWNTDRELRLTWLTGGAIRAFEGRRELQVGTDLYTFMETADPETPTIAAHLSALSGVASSFEQEVDDLVFSAHVAPLTDADGKVSGVVGVAIDITARVRAERQLRKAHDRLHTLSGLIPICMHCKCVRNDGGFWEQVEIYVREHSNAEFTHGICPDCMKRALDGDTAEA